MGRLASIAWQPRPDSAHLNRRRVSRDFSQDFSRHLTAVLGPWAKLLKINLVEMMVNGLLGNIRIWQSPIFRREV